MSAATLADKQLATSDNLSFTARDPEGRIDWFNVRHPSKLSSYDWGKEYDRGVGFAQELIKSCDDEGSEMETVHIACVCAEIARKSNVLPDGLYIGFFQGLTEIMRGSK